MGSRSAGTPSGGFGDSSRFPRREPGRRGPWHVEQPPEQRAPVLHVGRLMQRLQIDQMMARVSPGVDGPLTARGSATRRVVGLGLVLLPLLSPQVVAAEPRIPAALRRPVEGYAFAACLVAQDSAYLKEQGHGWGAVVLERSRGGLESLTALAAAVRSEAARTPMAVMHKDGPVSEPPVPLPILFCAELLQAPVVRAAKLRAMRRLRFAYRRRSDIPS